MRLLSARKRKKTTNRVTLGVVLPIILASAALRFAAVNERVIHIDEGMGLRASQLALQGEWRYYSANGHGPTLFYAGALLQAFAGPNLMIARTFTALCSLFLAIVVAWHYRTLLDGAGLVALASGIGFSSAFIFYGAYFIHEMLFIAFTACLVMAVERWYATKKDRFVLAAFASAALMYATKETAILTWAALIIALAAVRMMHPAAHSKPRTVPWMSIMTGVALALAIHVTLFTSFFTNPRGFPDSLMSPLHWFERSQTHHARPAMYFVQLLFAHELGLVLLAALGMCGCILKRVWSPRLTFLLAWFLAIVTIYSSIKYKTPWCIPNMVLPLALFAAFAVQRLWQELGKIGRYAYACAIVIAAMISLAQAARDGFGSPNRENDVSYAYLQSDASLDHFIGVLRGLSLLNGGKNMPVQVVGSPDELVYMLTDAYDRSFGPIAPGYPVYVNYQNDADAVAHFLRSNGGDYVRAVFTYIQHVNQIDLFIRRDLWERYVQSGMAIPPVSIGDMYDYRTQ